MPPRAAADVLATLSFVVITFMLAAYVLLDGYDLGIAAISPFIARTDAERAATMASIGPFWNGNEVWLIAAGGALFALFPAAYAAAFSGFYLPFMVVLWMLMFRGIAMELRDHLKSDLWHQFWDAAFWLSSALLIVLFGVALGNLVRGVPLDLFGYFQGTFGFLLNPYALLIAVFGLAAVAQHGAAFAAMRIDGEPAVRAVRLMRGLWWVVLALYAGASAATFATRGAPPGLWLYAVPLVSLAALVALRAATRGAPGFAAFGASSIFLVSLLAEASGTLYPYLLPAFPAGRGGISIYDAAPSAVGSIVALTATIVGSVAVLVYGSAVWRRMAAKVRVE
jgi:cytochrome d ubiquinol oxidase subunit II